MVKYFKLLCLLFFLNNCSTPSTAFLSPIITGVKTGSAYQATLSYSSNRYLIPPVVIGAGVFIISSLKSFKDTDEKNKRLIEYYVRDRVSDISPDRFLDFPNPTLVLQK